jgi:hypothetical protein
MANPQIQVDVKLNDADYQRGASNIQKSAKQMAQDFQKLGREISQVSQTMVFFGGAVTASIGTAFAKAAKDLPVIDQQLKEISNSFQALADNVAIAAAPSLEAFTKLVNGMVYTVSKFVAEHQQLVNQFIQYSAIALAVGTLGFAVGKLFSAFSNLIKLGSSIVTFFISLWNPITLIVAAVLALVAGVALLSDKFLGTRWIDDTVGLFKKLGATVNGFFKDFEIGTKQTTKRAVDSWGQFFQGFKDNLNTTAQNMKNFGAAVSSSMEKAFGDTIFNAIKGNFKDLKSVITSFADDILRAFSRMAANQFLAMLFGNKEGGTGIFSSLGAMLGFQGKSPVKETTKQFEDLTQNMKYFGREKDKVIDKLKDFGKGLQKAMPGGKTGGAILAGAAGAGGALSIDIGSFDGAAKAAEGLNAMLAGTMGFVAAIGTGFDMIGLKIIKMGIIYAVTTLAMLAVSIGAAAAQVAIGIATAAALSAAYIVPAILASIMTFGAAAAVGTAAVGAAMAGAGGMIAIGNASAGGGGGLPAGAGISFGACAFAKGAEGGIVTRPTFALIGEAGPEAVVPLNQTPGSSPLGGKMGSTRVNINIGTALLNNPSNMDTFVKKLKQELAR